MKNSSCQFTAKSSRTVSVRLENSDAEKWREFVRRYGAKEASDLIRSLIQQVMAESESPSASPGNHEKPENVHLPQKVKRIFRGMKPTATPEKGSHRLEIRLRPSEMTGVLAASAALGVSPQYWLIAGVRSMLTGGIFGASQEVATLNQSLYQMGRMGMNINQIARRIHAEPSLMGSLSAGAIDRMNKQIKQYLDEMRSVMGLAMGRGRLLFLKSGGVSKLQQSVQ